MHLPSTRAALASTKSATAGHKDRDDVWMIISNKVYDVTKYLEDHPGGEEVLLDKGGMDGI